MAKKIFIFISFIVAACSFFIPQAYSIEQDGGLPAYFLNLGIGARALGMGRSFVAVSDDLSGIYWNQAGLLRLRYPEISVTHTSLYEDTRYDSVGFARPAKNNLSYGLAVIQLYTGGIIKRDSNNVPGDEINDQNTALLLSGARSLNNKTAIGGSLKVINKAFNNTNMTWLGLDMSALCSPVEFIDVGFNIQNFLKSAFESSDGRDYRIPVKTRLGAASKLFNNKLIVSTDFEDPFDNILKPHLGAEWIYKEMFMLRGGYDDGYLTCGLGVLVRNYQLDYALLDHPLGLSHRLSFTYKFDESISRKLKMKETEPLIIIKNTNKYYDVTINTMKEIPTSVYHLFADRKIPVISVEIKNKMQEKANMKISYRIGIKDMKEDEELIIPGGESVNFDIIPELTREDIRRVEVVPTPTKLYVEIEKITEKGKTTTIYRNYYPVMLLPYDQFSSQIVDARGNKYNLLDTLVSWVTFNDRSLSEVLSKAGENGAVMSPPVKIVGFQSPNVFTKIPRDYRSLEERDNDYLSQIKLIYETLRKDYRITYVNQPIAYQNTQRIKLPSVTLKNKGNCIELSVLFASLLESIEIDPVLVIFPRDKHAAVGWKVSGEGKDVCKLIETNVFGEEFEKVIEKGKKLMEENELQKEFSEGIPFDNEGVYIRGDNVLILDVKKIRPRIHPSPYIDR